MSIVGITQQTITGLVEDDETGSPVSYASVTSEKGVGTMTDSAGNFSIDVRKQARLKDSLIVSATGYEPKRIAIKDLLGTGKIRLSQKESILEQVKIFASLKGDHRRFGYYREWKVKNQGGEIGYVFDVTGGRVGIGKVQVKINHNYDTCWLKLHLRDVAASGLSLPENELLKKDVILPATVKYGLVEFDLSWEPIIIPANKLYVGFELLKCGCSESSVPSFFFLGHEEGVNFYKETEESVWKRGGEYTIYVHMTTK
ncbi:MAG TPA: carboxypeptidase-like regulatory domain-containing protein [Chitinophagaceae bacterium]